MSPGGSVERFFLVEGHRDNFELTARRRKGDRCPLAAWLPRLQRASLNLSIIAVGGDGLVRFVLEIEGGRPFQEDYSSGKKPHEKLALLRTFFRLGIRSIHLTHNGRNELGDGGDEEDGGRLSRFGVAVLKEAQRLGMNVSLAHLTDSCIAHALAVAEKPVTATHDNARAVYPHPRNFTDAKLRAMDRYGGVGGMHLLTMM